MILELVSLEYCSPRGRLELIDGPEGLRALHGGFILVPQRLGGSTRLCASSGFMGPVNLQFCVIVISPGIGSGKIPLTSTVRSKAQAD